MPTIVERPTIRSAIVGFIDRTKWPEIEGVLAIGSFTLFSWCAWAVITHRVPEVNEKYIMLMLGALIGIVKDTFGRYFTSTKGAAEQRQDLMGLAKDLQEKK